jgi:hypothetical protein
MDYFIILSDLQIASEVEKINKLRNSLKHDFVLPSRMGILESVSTATVFFEANTKTIFDISFSEISLTDLVNNDPVRTMLKATERYIQESLFEIAMEEIAKAFDQLIQADDELLKYKWAFWSSNYKKITTYTIPQNFKQDEKSISSLAKHLKEVAETVNINMGRIDESIKVLSLGLDYRKYRKLMSLIPSVYRTATGSVITSKPKYDRKSLSTDAQFAFDFVLECALKVEQLSLV